MEVTKPILSLDQSIFSKTVPFTKVNGLEILDTVSVYKSGLMVLSMKAVGDGIKPMEKESSGMLMAMFLMENGRKIKLTVLVLILMSMVLNMKVSGSTTYNTDKVERFGKLAAVTKELIWKDRSTAVGNTSGKTIAAMMVNGTGT